MAGGLVVVEGDARRGEARVHERRDPLGRGAVAGRVQVDVGAPLVRRAHDVEYVVEPLERLAPRQDDDRGAGLLQLGHQPPPAREGNLPGPVEVEALVAVAAAVVAGGAHRQDRHVDLGLRRRAGGTQAETAAGDELVVGRGGPARLDQREVVSAADFHDLGVADAGEEGERLEEARPRAEAQEGEAAPREGPAPQDLGREAQGDRQRPGAGEHPDGSAGRHGHRSHPSASCGTVSLGAPAGQRREGGSE